MDEMGNRLTTSRTPSRVPITLPPESFEQPALTIDEAADLMADFGFVAFRTPPDAAVTDSCLMVMIRDAPTRRHFDPETVTYWIFENGHGRSEVAGRDARTPISRPYSWGRIRLVDRLGARNSFVSFGGWLTGERVGTDATLLIYRSPAPILRLPGHSQQRDQLSDEILAFFGRLVARLWSSPADERLVGSLPPEDLYAAFLFHESDRHERSTRLQRADPADAHALRRALTLTAEHQPDALATGRDVLSLLGLQPAAARKVM